MVTAPDPIEFYDLTKTALLNVESGNFILAMKVGGARIPELVVAVDEPVDHTDQIQIRVIDGAEVLWQGTVTDIQHRRTEGKAQKVLTIEGSSFFLTKKWAEDTTVTGNTDSAVDTLLALQVYPVAISLDIQDISGTNVESYNSRGYVATGVKDLVEMASSVVVEGYNGGPVLAYSKFGNRPGGAGTLELDGGNRDGELIASWAMPTPIVNFVRIEGEREDFGFYETWEPAGGGPWGSFVLSSTPTSNVTVYFRDNVGDVEKQILQGGSKQDEQDYYVDKDTKKVTFDAHTVVGAGRVYYFDYQGRHPVSAIVRNEGSIKGFWESWEEARNAIVKSQDDMELLANKWLRIVSKKELRCVAACFFRKTFLPNTTVRVIDRLSGMDQNFVLTEVNVRYPELSATLVFAENRPTLQEYLAGMKETMNRVDETPRDEGVTIRSLQRFFRQEVHQKLTAKALTSTDDITYTERWRNLQPPDDIPVVVI